MPTNEKTVKPVAKVFPHNFEAEQSVLCCLLIDGGVASNYIGKIPEDAFYSEKHRMVYRAMRHLNDLNESVDVVTVSDQMIKNGTGDDKTLEYLTELTNILPSAANCGNYVKILHRDMILRAIINKCNSVIEHAYSSTNEEETLRYAEKEIYGISNDLQKSALEPINKAATDLIERLDMLAKDKNAFKGLLTGFPKFDKLTNGLQRGDLIILAARPSVGKTAFALNIISNIIKRNEPRAIAMYSLEMPAVQLAQRMLCDLSNVTMDEINSGDLLEHSHEHLWEITKKLSNSHVYVNDASMISPTDIGGQCRRLCGSGLGFTKLDLIVVDYLGLMSLHADGRMSEDNRQLEVQLMSRQMKGLAKDLNCPVVLLSQMSRGIEQRKEKTPQLSDLRESGAIEQDADIVMFLSREDEAAKHDSPILLNIAKHRNGELDQIRLNFDGPHMRFSESNDQRKYVVQSKETNKDGYGEESN